MFPATVFVSVASGHLTLLAVGQVLQRSLEPAQPGYNGKLDRDHDGVACE
ncbi:excalibur calcium-binding domain-containing protein [Bifidobacterium longum]